MSNYIDIAGQQYGLLTPICAEYKDKWDEYWLCKCACGNQVIRGKRALRKGLTVSCGCDRYRRVSESLKRQNKYEIHDNYIIGFTTNGDSFLIDVDDYDIVKQLSWYKMKNGYICHKDKNGYILLHRLVMNPPDDMDIDHKNNDKTDNRKNNLRICNRSQNLAHKSYDNKTNYRGVVQLPSGKFMAQICNTYLGVFDTAQEAHNAYAQVAIEKYGEFICEEQINMEGESVDENNT